MNAHVSTAAAAAVMAVIAAPAMADYQNLSVELHNTVTISGTSYDVFRIYANFTNPEDRLVGAFGSPTLGSLTIESRNSDDSGPGGSFFNAGLNSFRAPTAATIALEPAFEWDTFMTVGLAIADQSPFGDITFLTPGMQEIAGTSYTITDGGWFAFPTFDHDENPSTPDIPPPQTIAGWTGDGDDALRVMLLQLTVPSGDNVRGIINIDVFPPFSQGGGGQVVLHQPFQTFNSFVVPNPASLVLLGMAALLRMPRRRN